MTKSNTGRKGFICLLHPDHSPIIEGSQGRNLRQELKHKPWFAVSGLFCLLSFIVQYHMSRAAHSELDSSPMSLAYRPVLWRYVLSHGLLFRDASNLGQDDN